MNIAIYTLKSIAYALVDPYFILLITILGFLFYRQNKKTTMIQKMIVGESLNSPLELTMSQIVIGIFAGAFGSMILSYMGVMFNENSGIEILFLISILLMFFNPRFVCFAYSGAILGFLSLFVQIFNTPINESINNMAASTAGFYIDIVSLMTLIGVLHMVEGILVMLDGGRGAVPVFTNKDGKIVGGFALKRYWPIPIAIFLILNSSLAIGEETLKNPSWWPIIKTSFNADMLKNTVLTLMPFYGVIGYTSVTFSKSKESKSKLSGVGILLYGTILTIVAQLANYGLAWKCFVLVFAPMAHELMLKVQKYIEEKSEPKYISDDEGIMILEVAPNSPAYEVGIKSGDKLLEINDNKIESDDLLHKFINKNLNYLKLKIKDSKGKIKNLTLNYASNTGNIGVVLVPRDMPKDTVVVKYDDSKFKEIFDKMKKQGNEEEQDKENSSFEEDSDSVNKDDNLKDEEHSNEEQDDDKN